MTDMPKAFFKFKVECHSYQEPKPLRLLQWPHYRDRRMTAPAKGETHEKIR